MFLSKYGVARVIEINIPKAGSANHAVGADWTPAAGDVKISKDGGAAANVTNLPTAIAMGNSAIWSFSLTATEMQAARINITVSDSATKAVDDTGFVIETYGNASAQHEFDLDTASVAQTGDSFARIGAAGAGLTALGDTRVANLDATVSSRMATYVQPTGFLAATFPTTVASTTNITAGTITTVTNLTNLPAITNNWLTTAGIADGAFTAAKFAASSLNGKGDWFLAASAPVNIQLLAIGADGVAEANVVQANGTPVEPITIPDIVEQMLAGGDFDGFSFEEFGKICLAVLAGKVSGVSSSSPIFRAADDSKARVSATTGADGRTAVTIDATG